MRTSSNFFNGDVEPLIVRRLAFEMGYIPCGVDVFKLTERKALATLHDNSEFLKEAFLVENGIAYVRGTHHRFPLNGPSCKFTALVDARPEFDALWLSFLIHVDPPREVHKFLLKLQSPIEEHMDAVSEATLNRAFAPLAIATAWSNLRALAAEPPDFARRALGAYIECAKDTSY